MCRYAGCEYGPYKEHYACFACRKSFKQQSRWELPESRRPAPGEERVALCPQCRRSMAYMGMDFKAPPQTDVKQWEKVRALYAAGFAFDSCGCGGPGYRPKDLKEVADFIASNRKLSEGEELLKKIDARLSKSSS
jgi:hypothetical protein